METNKPIVNPVFPGNKPKKNNTDAIVVCALIALIILFFFVLPIATLTDSYSTWSIKSPEALKDCNVRGSVGWCMGEAGFGIFKLFVLVGPLLWLLTAVFAFIKKNVAKVLSIVTTVLFVLFAIFLKAGVSKLYGMPLSFGIGTWIIIVLSVVCIVCLFTCRKRAVKTEAAK